MVMGRRTPTALIPDPGPSEDQFDRWLGHFLLANDGGPAATVSAELKDTKGLTAKWAVIDKLGLREGAVRHMEHCREIHVRNKAAK